MGWRGKAGAGGQFGSGAVARNVFWAFASAILGYAAQFAVAPAVTAKLGVAAYGWIGIASSFSSYADVAAVGLNSFAGRHVSVAWMRGDREGAKRWYSSALAADLAICIAIGTPSLAAIAAFARFGNPDGTTASDVALLFAMTLARFALNATRAANDAAALCAGRVDATERQIGAGSFLTGALTLAAFAFLPPRTWYVGAAGAAGAALTWALALGRRNGFAPGLRFERASASLAAARTMAASGAWNSLNALGNVLNSGLDLVVAGAMLSGTAAGEVAVGKQLAGVAYAFVTRISSSYRPKMTRAYADGDKDALAATARSAMGKTGAFCVMATAGFAACGRDFVGLWLPDADADAVFALSLICLLADVVPSVVNPLYYSFTLADRPKAPCVVTLCMGAANVGAMIALIAGFGFGAEAVVGTTLVLNCAHLVDTPLLAARAFGLPARTFAGPIARHAAACAGAFGVAAAFANLAPEAGGWLPLAAKCAAAGIAIAPFAAFEAFGWSAKKRNGS